MAIDVMAPLRGRAAASSFYPVAKTARKLPKGVRVRAARDSDAEAVIALVAGVWSEYPGKTLVVPKDMPELQTPASSYAARDGRFWVLEDAGRIVGTIAVAPSEAEDGVVELQKLYVARSHRRHGLGALLCGLVEDEAEARGAHAVELWSDVKLLDAHRLYDRLGYRRGTALKTYTDTSGTVRCYYRKEVAAASRSPWQVRPVRTMFKVEARFAPVTPAVVRRFSLTSHPATVGESYWQHMRVAAGFGARLIGAGLACLVHAVLPFAFVRTGSTTVVRLHERMVTSRAPSQAEPGTTARAAAARETVAQ